MSDDRHANEESAVRQPRYQVGSELLGEAARRRREVLGLTQEDVAERFGGPSVATMRTIENAQADNYRSKTLLSLDHAFSWFRGTADLLMTGRPERLLINYKIHILDTYNIEIDRIRIDPVQLARFVDHVINHVSTEDAIKYGIDAHLSRGGNQQLGASSGEEGSSEAVRNWFEPANQTESAADARRRLNERLSTARTAVEHRPRRSDMSDRDLLLEAITRLTPAMNDPRIRSAVQHLVPVAFGGIIDKWHDLFNEDGNLAVNIEKESDGER